MQHNLFRSGLDLDPGSNFKMKFQGQTIVYSTRLDKNMMAGKINVVTFSSKKAMAEKIFFS